MWEVFTCGKMPYGRMKNSEVVEKVQKGSILERPKSCDKEIYDVSLIHVNNQNRIPTYLVYDLIIVRKNK